MNWFKTGNLLLTVWGMTLLGAFGACRSTPARESPVDPKFAFDALDTNKDEKLSVEEFSKLPLDKDEARRIFKQLDKDGNGYLTRDEFKPVGVVYKW
ncbi:MAG: EF-hand domain-containing protein [Elusimicrobia bacterium]|nr:EF-hand domain-containing protein [Elusimicrobiota bacterium]